ncbi:ribosomal protein S16 (chloroplast) [Chaetoceros tenuissimus]|jgi:small subunit ribosomal protein S16|uniref:Small ribosomal subunit protein bS16c n=1 Tax=Chaetoceros tenuissimus TaxID=426638 RepID=A0A8F5J9S0_9STRA|nr:ribosomal protein S16 [Chaetoceros tenuissimus]BCD42043.1 ribosomal protein S16 [Chaetoceros tenuissimus]
MLKLRLTRTGRKKQPTYRLVVIEHSTRRDGRPVDSVGYYNPLTKESHFKVEKIQKWLQHGVQPSDTVASLLKKANIIE